jgi:hypothetical protein
MIGMGSGISSAPMETSTTVSAPRTAVMPDRTAGVAPEQSMNAPDVGRERFERRGDVIGDRLRHPVRERRLDRHVLPEGTVDAVSDVSACLGRVQVWSDFAAWAVAV